VSKRIQSAARADGLAARAEVARRQAKTIFVGWLILCAFLVTSIVAAGLRDWRAGQPIRLEQLRVTLYMVAILGIVTIALRWNVRLAPARVYAESKAPPAKPQRTPAWIWLVLVFVIGGMIYTSAPKGPPVRGRRVLPQQADGPPIGLIAVLGAGAFVACFILYVLLKNYDRRMSQIMKRAREGDVDGAIRELEEEIDTKGRSASRVYSLGMLMGSKERNQDAYKLFVEAEQLGFDRATCLSNQGVMLSQMDHHVEAVFPLEEANRLSPNNALFASNLAGTLSKAGRHEDALREIERAEAALKSTIFLFGIGRNPLEKLVAECRERIDAAAAGSKPSMSGEL
jgi:hypothetical protein